MVNAGPLSMPPTTPQNKLAKTEKFYRLQERRGKRGEEKSAWKVISIHVYMEKSMLVTVK